jgi:hypothetical protein
MITPERRQRTLIIGAARSDDIISFAGSICEWVREEDVCRNPQVRMKGLQGRRLVLDIHTARLGRAVQLRAVDADGSVAWFIATGFEMPM